MKLSSIRVQNFKSIRDTEFKLNEDINILVGKNNSGKSNVILAVTTLSQITTSNFNNISNFFTEKFGGFKEIAFGRRLPCSLSFEVSFVLSDEDVSDIYGHYPDWEKAVARDSFPRILKYQLRIKGDESGWGQPEVDFEGELVSIERDGKEIPVAIGSWQTTQQVRQGTYNSRVLKDIIEVTKTEGWDYIQTGGRAPAMSIVANTRTHYPTQPMEYLLTMISGFLNSVQKLDPFRVSPDKAVVKGAVALLPDASNLPQVLNTLASSRRELYDKIVRSARTIIEELSEIRAPLVEGTPTTYLSVTEEHYPSSEFLWNNISSGARETLYLITLLHITPKGSLIVIEEPELHLHWEAQAKLTNLMNEVAKTDGKQILITTHSPALIDSNSLEKIFVVTREAGETKVVPLVQYELVEGVAKAGIPRQAVTPPRQSKYILVVESREDGKIWSQFFKRSGLDPERNQITIMSGLRESGEGKDEAIHVANLLRRIGTGIPWMVLLDSDGQLDALTKELERHGIRAGNYHIMKKKEIESYLIDAGAIAKISNKPIDEVKQTIERTGSGKEGLDSIFKHLGLTKPDSSVKELLAVNLPALDTEIVELISHVRQEV